MLVWNGLEFTKDKGLVFSSLTLYVRIEMSEKLFKTDVVIIGAGPVGLFAVFELGLLDIKCHLIDILDVVGGQCSELYPEKPIYDIPGVAFQTAQEHVDALLLQIKPFDYDLYLNQRVETIEETNQADDMFWKVTTNENNSFISKNIFIAAGAGSFEARRPPNIDDPDKFLNHGVNYAVRSKEKYKGVYWLEEQNFWRNGFIIIEWEISI